MSEQKLNRREFLERAALIGAAAIGAGSLLSACDPPEQDAEPAEPEAEAQPEDADFSCNDEEALAGLDEDDIQRRESHEYVDDSPVEGEYCYNCMHWEDPAAGEDCGGCAMIPGPFHPDGWCNIWAPAA